jgi:hypothetical protein
LVSIRAVPAGAGKARTGDEALPGQVDSRVQLDLDQRALRDERAERCSR